MKKRANPGEYTNVMLDQEAEEESYKRYKHRCYRNLVLKSLLTFLLGMLLACLFEVCKGVFSSL